jgi:pimeloyl-ACP methyl ester carboxylesterase
VVLIPGIGGSVLARRGKDVWSLSPGAALRGVLSLGRSVNQLRLHSDDPDVDDLGDEVVATRLMPDLHVVPGLDWKIDGYGRIRDQLLSRFDCVPGKNYFEFPYDWRRDNRVAARRLARSAEGWLHRWRAESGNNGAKLILIAHSMGGIVARMFLEQHEGWRSTRQLITFGTPYSGSVNALEFLANGFRKGWGPFTVDLTDTLRSFTSVYQLLPSYRCLEGPGGSWLNLDEVNWSGTGVDGPRLTAAITLARQLRTTVDERLAAGDEGYEIRPVIGDFQRTRWAARRLADGQIQSLWMRALDEDGGDGTVPRVSAIPHELLRGWRNAALVGQKHASLQNDGPVLDHVSGVLRLKPMEAVDVYPAPDENAALEVDDVLFGEPLTIRARAARPGAELVASVEQSVTGETKQVRLRETDDGWRQAVLEGLAATDYRVTVTAVGVHPVTEVVSVVDPDDITGE